MRKERKGIKGEAERKEEGWKEEENRGKFSVEQLQEHLPRGSSLISFLDVHLLGGREQYTSECSSLSTLFAY